MAEIASLAQPYVRAIFDIARADANLAEWSDRLALLKMVTTDPQVAALDGHPKVGSEQLAGLVIGVCGDGLSNKGQNLVRLLVANKRLSVVAEIAVQYEKLRADAENQIEAELETATEIDDPQKRKISEALQAKLGRTVNLKCKVNADLLGGAVVRTGDWVYDGSIKAQLQKMAAALSA